MFNSHGTPVGAQITNYLLEKVSTGRALQDIANIPQNRVVGQIAGERDFHIFYQFTKGASAAQRGSYTRRKRDVG